MRAGRLCPVLPSVLSENYVQEGRQHAECLIAWHLGAPWEQFDSQLARDTPYLQRDREGHFL